MFKNLIVLLVLTATSANAQSHTVTVSCTPSTSNVAGYNFYRSGIKLNTSVIGPCSYVDKNPDDGQTYSYIARSVDASGMESVDSNVATAVIPGTSPPPPPQPPPSGPQVGDRIKVISTANIRATAVNNGFGMLYATEPTNALGTVTIVTNAAVPGVTATWTQVHFDSCVSAIPNCTGYMGSNNMTVVTTPPPPPPPTLTLDCPTAKTGFTSTNMPSGTNLTITGSAAGVTKSCMISLP